MDGPGGCPVIAEFYTPGRTFLHRWDARAKLLVLPLVLAGFFLPSPPWVLLIFTAGIAAVLALALGPSQLLPPLKAVWPVLVLILFLTSPFHLGGVPVLRVLGVTLLTSEGLDATLVFMLRFFGITIGFFAILRTVSLDDVVLSLRWFGLPYNACLVMTITMRMIPTLAVTWHAVRDAHRLRAGAIQRRQPLVGTYLPVLTSVMIEAVKGIPLLAMALESRGFGRRNARTSLSGLKRGPALLADALAFAAVAAALLWPALIRW
jgi:energy-coupling factor transport system permease protein